MDFGLETSNDTVKMATGNRALHQLRLVVFFSPIFFGKVLYIPGGAGCFPSTVAPENWQRAPKGKDLSLSILSIHFQVRTVSFLEDCHIPVEEHKRDG